MGDKRVDIKTGYICNNNCRFCVQADNKFKGNRSFEEIKKDLISSRKRCDGVVLTGGEVTIRKDFFEIVKSAKNLGYKTIQVQTNGRMFSSLDFCKKTIKAGVTEFSPALHGYCAEQHDSLTRAEGSFRQTVQGIKNLKSLGQFVMTNTVVVKGNYKNIPEIAKLLVKLGVDQFQFAFVHAMGNALKNFDSVVPLISLAAPYIKKGLQIGIDAGKKVMAEAMPYCLMQGYEDYVSEQYIPETEIAYGNNIFTEDYKKARIKEGKLKFKQCKKCKFNSICEGPWKEYPERFGEREFSPIIRRYRNEIFYYINTIKKRGINVPDIKRFKDKTISVQWIDGLNLDSYLNLNHSKINYFCKKAAQILGKIHSKQIVSVKKEEAKRRIQNSIQYVLESFKQELKKQKVYEKTKEFLKKKFPKIFVSDVVHNDFWFKNLIIKKNKLYLIDFGNVEKSFLEMDLLHIAFCEKYNDFMTQYKKQNSRTKMIYNNFEKNKLFYQLYYLLMTDKQKIKDFFVKNEI